MIDVYLSVNAIYMYTAMGMEQNPPNQHYPLNTIYMDEE